MVNVLVRHKVKNYKSWKPVFDGFIETRRAGGEKSYQIFHPDNDRNNLLLLFKWDDAKKGHKFFESSDLKKTMKEAGVMGEPEIFFLEEYEHGDL